MIRIELPRALQPYAQGSTAMDVDHPCATVSDAFTALASRFPRVLDSVINERGEVRTHVNVFVDEMSIRFLAGLDTPVGEGSTIVIVAAVSGG
ncbi:MAG: MoaD/ThiS family protein [Gemmatimonadaceae bacterium]